MRSTQSTESISDIGLAQTNEEEAELKEDIRKLCEDRKGDIAKVIIQSPGAIVSRRLRHRVKDVFLSDFNQGGLIICLPVCFRIVGC